MSRTAITLSGTKEAALYFDHVVPLMLIYDAALEADDFDKLIGLKQPEFFRFMVDQRNQFVELLPPQLSEGTSGFEKFVELNTEAMKVLNLLDNLPSDYDENTPMRDLIRDRIEPLGGLVGKFLSNADIPQAAFTTQELLTCDNDEPAGDVAVTLSGLNLVDINKVSIDHLNQFRKDTEAVAALRQLRVFAESQYQGKSKAFIEDDLLHRLNDYDSAAKKWGFELIETGFTTLFGSKTAVGTIAGTVAAIMAGSPIVATSTAIIGTALEIGKLTIKISRTRFDAREALGSHPVSYLVKARAIQE